MVQALTPSGRYVKWDVVIAAARLRRGQWVLMFPNHTLRLVLHIRQRRSPELEALTDGGGPPLEVMIRHKHKGDDGKFRADIYVRLPETG